jgi:predicted alpha/beta-fold hydrolase
VPSDQFDDPALRSNPHVRVVLTPRGGHCGFLAAAGNSDDGYWAERAVVSFALANAGATAPERPFPS